MGRRLRRRGWLVGLWLVAAAAHAQFANLPEARRPTLLLQSDAANERAYREHAARHVYATYPSRVLKGMVPPLVYAIVVTETHIDARGNVLSVRVVRQPASANEVSPWVVSLIRRASPLPPPLRMGRVRYVETWLVDKSGQFQVRTLTEGQL
jgi:hypothetical protein